MITSNSRAIDTQASSAQNHRTAEATIFKVDAYDNLNTESGDNQ